ncbi:MFS general substrate transporter [Colletotrichum sublineola]|nr:MFS general substrate transporter [Colletotrichum sublineola]
MAAEASSLNAGQPKPKDPKIAEKQPSRPGSADEGLKAGQVDHLGEAEIFLHQNGICHAQMPELLEDEEAQKKLVRKVDSTLLTLLMGTYLLQYINKQALSYGAVFDLFETAKTIQSHYLAQRFPTGIVVSAFVVSWETVLACTAASRNFAGLAICRFLLGSFEAVITPCFMMILSMRYTRSEAPMRAGSFYCFNGFGSMIGGILFYGVGQADGWDRYTVQEKEFLIARSQSNKTGVSRRKIKPDQIKEAFKDLQVWLLFFYTLLNEVVNGDIVNFGKFIVKGFTKDALLTTAYSISYGAWVVFFIFSGPFCASKFKNFRTIVMMTWVLPTLVVSPLFVSALVVCQRL